MVYLSLVKQLDPQIAYDHIANMRRAPRMYSFTKEAFVREVSVFLHLAGLGSTYVDRPFSRSPADEVNRFIGAKGCVAFDPEQAIQEVTNEWAYEVCDYALNALRSSA